ncbi:hypothetical protein CEXT_182481 [Caerostris extrusa]|uniref:Uncharacterized protein n=1 Tax=Caerostris extrusa TaxID=172846 RepID=A0AAV4MV61_CAEEX|nr:hypothetical protein CEXT_182481 [Caerostris extrusa]
MTRICLDYFLTDIAPSLEKLPVILQIEHIYSIVRHRTEQPNVSQILRINGGMSGLMSSCGSKMALENQSHPDLYKYVNKCPPGKVEPIIDLNIQCIIICN